MPVAPGHRRTKQITETLRHCPNRKAAEGVLAKRNAAIFDGSYKPRSTLQPTLLSAFVTSFLESRKGELRAWSSYKSSLLLHVVPVLGKKHLHSITSGDCEDYRRKRLAAGAAPATVRNELRYLQSVYADAKKRELVDKDPVASVSFEGIRNSPEHAPRPADILRMAEAAREEPPHSYVRPLFFLLLATGLRLKSALTLKWEHVDHEAGCIGTEQKGGTWVYPPMPELLAAELKLWEPMSNGLGVEGYVFPGIDGGHIGTTAVQKAWVHLLRRAGVEGITRHDLRRFMITRLRELGADNKQIQRVSGHSTSAMIDRYDKRGLASAAVFAEQASDLISISKAANLEAKGKQRKRKS